MGLSKKELKMKMKENLKKRLKESNERASSSGGGGLGVFKAEGKDLKYLQTKADESYIIDIVPYVAGENSPLDDYGNPKNPPGESAYVLEFWVHKVEYNGKNMKIVCPKKNFNKPCPICERWNKLINSDAPKEEIDAVKPSLRVAYNTMCYLPDSEESKGVQIFSLSHWYSEKEFQKKAKKIVRKGKNAGDPYIYYMSPDEEGKSIAFTQEGKTENWKITGIDFQDRDYELEQDVLDQAYCLEDLLNILSYDEIHKIFYGESVEKENEEVIEEKPVVRKGRGKKVEPDPEPEPVDDPVEDPEDDPEDDPDPEPETENKTVSKKQKKLEKANKKEVKKDECPEGYEFGVQWDDFAECSGCDLYDKCESKWDELNDVD